MLRHGDGQVRHELDGGDHRLICLANRLARPAPHDVSNIVLQQKRRRPMNYVDGFVLAVPTANREIYKTHAENAAVVFKEHGALTLVECWGDDVPEGEVTSFPMAVKRKPDETVVFAWITWPSREVRDAGMKKVMEDPRLQAGAESMPFDGKRMIYGGFQKIVDA
jgi:uncharacterized protein YbaA (DUF1428 family)